MQRIKDISTQLDTYLKFALKCRIWEKMYPRITCMPQIRETINVKSVRVFQSYYIICR